ncbi:hypothetical protein [Candidatus Galacturonibacter soehngenii]|uniref:Carboxypeptidase regulatory-like domain-containing protein n=1 Tax=Candidatus Galacturonatibacter soehngenii TaxID=2307010 RepID=A0A7V7QJH7_9FIRM|nr:hypothetical protein [Candidatus Galacturonibacter soehngenii]KAB1437783.1 hypothetical protein F7O84_09315 [Candidatus Galacturonibacter soehngenii]MBA4687451.1 hypothetical protein [Candidatus Galacturonibacter soehngenii]
MSGYREIIITPEEMSHITILQKDISIRRTKDALIIGTIYSPERKAIEGAVIEVVAIHNGNCRVKMGYVLTNYQGEFAFVVEKNNCTDYLLNAYEPLEGIKDE